MAKGLTTQSESLMQRIVLTIALLMLFSVSIIGCEPRLPGPEVRRDGVHFSLYSPEAKNIAIAGSFNQWDVRKDMLTGPDKNGVWTIILPLPEGRYEYLFFINKKEWRLDPATPLADDGFGGKNSVVVIEK
jgi:1,4-alpha-glucan branching enzyme